jgi:hypothetical protein
MNQERFVGLFREFLLKSGFRKRNVKNEDLVTLFTAWLNDNFPESLEDIGFISHSHMVEIVEAWGVKDEIRSWNYRTGERHDDHYDFMDYHVCNRCGGFRYCGCCTACGSHMNYEERDPKVKDKETASLTDYF